MKEKTLGGQISFYSSCPQKTEDSQIMCCGVFPQKTETDLVESITPGQDFCIPDRSKGKQQQYHFGT